MLGGSPCGPLARLHQGAPPCPGAPTTTHPPRLQVEGVPEEVVFDHLHATAFQQTPLGRTILGPADNVRRLTRDDLAAYVKKNYTAPRMAR